MVTIVERGKGYRPNISPLEGVKPYSEEDRVRDFAALRDGERRHAEFMANYHPPAPDGTGFGTYDKEMTLALSNSGPCATFILRVDRDDGTQGYWYDKNTRMIAEKYVQEGLEIIEVRRRIRARRDSS